jgi:hypothetical protein
MRYTALLAIAVLAAIAQPSVASLNIINGANLTALPINGNDFNGNLDDFVDQLYNNGADVQATAAGTVQFYLHASESGFTNQFVKGTWNGAGTSFTGGTVFGTESENAWSNLGTAIGLPIAVLAGDKFSTLGIGFHVQGTPSGSLDARAGTAGFGVFRLAASGDNGYTRLFFGFDDNGAGVDDNHDDMIVSAVFTPDANPLAVVPEPMSLAIWCGLAVTFGVSQMLVRRRQSRGRSI